MSYKEECRVDRLRIKSFGRYDIFVTEGHYDKEVGGHPFALCGCISFFLCLFRSLQRRHQMSKMRLVFQYQGGCRLVSQYGTSIIQFFLFHYYVLIWHF